MDEMIAADVPGGGRSLLYASTICGGSSIYRCYWLPRWLRCLSVFYQVILLIIYISVTTVALVVYRSSHSLSDAYGDEILNIYLIPIMSNVMVLCKIFHGSGEFALFQRGWPFQSGHWYVVNNKIQRGVILIIVGLVTVSLGSILM